MNSSVLCIDTQNGYKIGFPIKDGCIYAYVKGNTIYVERMIKKGNSIETLNVRCAELAMKGGKSSLKSLIKEDVLEYLKEMNQMMNLLN